MEEANIASRAKAQEFIQATSQVREWYTESVSSLFFYDVIKGNVNTVQAINKAFPLSIPAYISHSLSLWYIQSYSHLLAIWSLQLTSPLLGRKHSFNIIILMIYFSSLSCRSSLRPIRASHSSMRLLPQPPPPPPHRSLPPPLCLHLPDWAQPSSSSTAPSRWWVAPKPRPLTCTPP